MPFLANGGSCTMDTSSEPDQRIPPSAVPEADGKASDSPVSNFDKEDGRIIELKLLGFTDRQAAEKLRLEGFGRHQDKAVGSRWSRLRKILSKVDEERLDDECSDWHAAEDEELTASYKAIEDKVEKEIQKIYDKRWSQIADILAGRLGQKKYSGRACRDRYEGLQDGTALKAIEEDSDIEGRRELRKRRIAAAKVARAEEKIRLEAERAAQKSRGRASEYFQEDDTDREATKSELRRRRLSEKMRIQKERRALNRQARVAKAATLKQMRAERHWHLERMRKEREVYRNLTGKDLNTELREAREALSALQNDMEKANLDNHLRRGRQDGGRHLPDEDYSDFDDYSTTSDRRYSGRMGSETPLPPDSNIGPRVMRSTNGSSFPTAGLRTVVTKETLQNPRTVMSDVELGDLLVHRGLPPRGRSETHAEMVARLAVADRELIVPDLKDLLRDNNERTDGKKEELIRRLQNSDAALSFQGEMGIRPTDYEFMKSYAPYREHFAHLLAEARPRSRRSDDGDKKSE